MARKGSKKAGIILPGRGIVDGSRVRTQDENIASLLATYGWTKDTLVGVEGADERFILVRSTKSLTEKVQEILGSSALEYCSSVDFKVDSDAGLYRSEVIFYSAGTDFSDVTRVPLSNSSKLLAAFGVLSALTVEPVASTDAGAGAGGRSPAE